jgi:predicted nucleic acid-binding protein
MAARAVFLDTNGWFAVLNEEDVLHSRAAILWLELSRARRPLLLTDWVVAETGNGLARTQARNRFVETVQQMLKTPRFRIVSVTPALMERALLMYSDRPDKSWGLVDCASFILMQDEGISEAFTTDRHFEQAGFTCLLPAYAP